MRKLILIILLLLITPSVSFAAMNSFYKECMQRGYEIYSISSDEVISEFLNTHNLSKQDWENETFRKEYLEENPYNFIHEGEYCRLPNNTTCKVSDFNEGLCGSEYKSEDYCIPRGRVVWDEDKCCFGLKPYLPGGMVGQTECEPFYYQISYLPLYFLFFIFVIVPKYWILILAIVGLLIFWIFKKKSKKATEVV